MTQQFLRIEDWPFFQTCICTSPRLVHLRWTDQATDGDDVDESKTVCGRRHRNDQSPCRKIHCRDCLQVYLDFLDMDTHDQ